MWDLTTDALSVALERRAAYPAPTAKDRGLGDQDMMDVQVWENRTILDDYTASRRKQVRATNALRGLDPLG